MTFIIKSFIYQDKDRPDTTNSYYLFMEGLFMKGFKKLFAALTALTITASMCSFAVSAADGDNTKEIATYGASQTVASNTTLTEEVVCVVVPTSFALTLDPHGIKSDDAISSTDFTLVNKSNIPVDVAVTLTTTASGVTLAESSDDIVNNGTAVAHLGFYSSNAWTGSGAPEYKDAESFALKANNTFDYYLKAATFDDNVFSALAGEKRGCTAFKIKGDLDELYLWKNTSIKVAAAYKITSMKAATADTRYRVAKSTEDQNMIVPTLLTKANEKPTEINEGADILTLVGIGSATIKSVGTYDATSGKITALVAKTNYVLTGNSISFLGDNDHISDLAITLSNGTVLYQTSSGLVTALPKA